MKNMFPCCEPPNLRLTNRYRNHLRKRRSRLKGNSKSPSRSPIRNRSKSQSRSPGIHTYSPMASKKRKKPTKKILDFYRRNLTLNNLDQENKENNQNHDNLKNEFIRYGNALDKDEEHEAYRLMMLERLKKVNMTEEEYEDFIRVKNGALDDYIPRDKLKALLMIVNKFDFIDNFQLSKKKYEEYQREFDLLEEKRRVIHSDPKTSSIDYFLKRVSLDRAGGEVGMRNAITTIGKSNQLGGINILPSPKRGKRMTFRKEDEPMMKVDYGTPQTMKSVTPRRVETERRSPNKEMPDRPELSQYRLISQGNRMKTLPANLPRQRHMPRGRSPNNLTKPASVSPATSMSARSPNRQLPRGYQSPARTLPKITMPLRRVIMRSPNRGGTPSVSPRRTVRGTMSVNRNYPKRLTNELGYTTKAASSRRVSLDQFRGKSARLVQMASSSRAINQVKIPKSAKFIKKSPRENKWVNNRLKAPKSARMVSRFSSNNNPRQSSIRPMPKSARVISKAQPRRYNPHPVAQTKSGINKRQVVTLPQSSPRFFYRHEKIPEEVNRATLRQEEQPEFLGTNQHQRSLEDENVVERSTSREDNSKLSPKFTSKDQKSMTFYESLSQKSKPVRSFENKYSSRRQSILPQSSSEYDQITSLQRHESKKPKSERAITMPMTYPSGFEPLEANPYMLNKVNTKGPKTISYRKINLDDKGYIDSTIPIDNIASLSPQLARALDYNVEGNPEEARRISDTTDVKKRIFDGDTERASTNEPFVIREVSGETDVTTNGSLGNMINEIRNGNFSIENRVRIDSRQLDALRSLQKNQPAGSFQVNQVNHQAYQPQQQQYIPNNFEQQALTAHLEAHKRAQEESEFINYQNYQSEFRKIEPCKLNNKYRTDFRPSPQISTQENYQEKPKNVYNREYESENNKSGIHPSDYKQDPPSTPDTKHIPQEKMTEAGMHYYETQEQTHQKTPKPSPQVEDFNAGRIALVKKEESFYANSPIKIENVIRISSRNQTPLKGHEQIDQNILENEGGISRINKVTDIYESMQTEIEFTLNQSTKNKSSEDRALKKLSETDQESEMAKTSKNQTSHESQAQPQGYYEPQQIHHQQPKYVRQVNRNESYSKYNNQNSFKEYPRNNPGKVIRLNQAPPKYIKMSQNDRLNRARVRRRGYQDSNYVNYHDSRGNMSRISERSRSNSKAKQRRGQNIRSSRVNRLDGRQSIDKQFIYR